MCLQLFTALNIILSALYKDRIGQFRHPFTAPAEPSGRMCVNNCFDELCPSFCLLPSTWNPFVFLSPSFWCSKLVRLYSNIDTRCSGILPGCSSMNANIFFPPPRSYIDDVVWGSEKVLIMSSLVFITNFTSPLRPSLREFNDPLLFGWPIDNRSIFSITDLAIRGPTLCLDGSKKKFNLVLINFD